MMTQILAIDLGLSALKVLAGSPQGEINFCTSESYPTYAPHPGWVEQNPRDWITALNQALGSIPQEVRRDIVAISFSGHMSSALLVSNKNNEALTQCLTITDTRGASYLPRLNELRNQTLKITGNKMLASASWLLKVFWLLDHLDMPQEEVKVIFAKDYLRLYLTGEIGTEYTDCGNTGLMNYSTVQWDDYAVKLSGIPAKILPEIHCPYEKAGNLLKEPAHSLGLNPGIPVFFGGADMACGAIGVGINEDSRNSAITLGSCATTLTTVNSNTNLSEGVGKISFHPYVLPNTKYGLGSHFTGGLGVNWFSGLFDGNTLEPDYDKLNQLAEEAAQIPPGCDGLIFLPFLVGSGSPHNFSFDRGSFIGLTLSTSRGSLFRSVLEGIAYNLFETQMIFEKMAGEQLNICLGGGGVNIKPWPGIIADVFGRNMTFLPEKNVSALGALMIGSFGSGLSDSIFPVIESKNTEPIFFNEANHKIYKEKFIQYQNYYKALSPLFKNNNLAD